MSIAVAASPAPPAAAPAPPVAGARDASPTSGLRHVPDEIRQAFPLPGPDSTGGPMGRPPERGGEVEQQELEALRLLQSARTPEGDAWSRHMDHEGHGSVWLEQAREYRAGAGPVEGAVGTAVLGGVIGAAAVGAAAGKLRFRRDRPFVLDPTLQPVVRQLPDPSFPSGHTTIAFAGARVLSRLDPERADEVYDLAHQVGYSRMYGGAHFPSDVAAGAALGTSVADAGLRVAGRGARLVEAGRDAVAHARHVVDAG